MTLKNEFNEMSVEDQRAFVQAACDGNKDAVLEFLNKYGDSVFDAKACLPSTGSLTALGMSAYLGKLEMIEFLLEKGSPIDERDAGGRTPIFCANLEAVKLLVEKGVDIDAQDNDGWTALMLEAINGELDRVKYLLELGASPELENNEGRNAASLARGDRDYHIAKFLEELELEKDIADFSPALKRTIPAPRPLKAAKP